MNSDRFKSSFSGKLNTRNNYDLFGPDIYENLHWGKLFIHLFGEYFSRYTLCRRVNTQELLKSLIQQYSLGQSQVIRIDRAEALLYPFSR